MTLKNFILTKAKERGGSLSVDMIYAEHFKQMKTKNHQIQVSQALRELREEGLIERPNLKRSNIIKLSESDDSKNEVTPEPEKVTPTEEPKTMYLYVFGAKVHYVDSNSPEQQKKSHEFRVQVTAESIIEALKRAEIEVRNQSNGFEFSLMNLFGSTVTVYPPRKRE